MFLKTNSVNFCQNSVSQNCRDVKNEVFEKKLAFLLLLFLCCCKRTEKQKQKKAKNTYKNRVFKVVIQKWEKYKNGFLEKIAWQYVCQEGRKNAHSRAHYLFWPKMFGPKQWKPRKNYKKNSGFSGNCPKPKKWQLFLKKVFLTWVTKWVSPCFWKAVFFCKHYCWKNRKFMQKIVGCYLTWQKGVLCLFFFRR